MTINVSFDVYAVNTDARCLNFIVCRSLSEQTVPFGLHCMNCAVVIKVFLNNGDLKCFSENELTLAKA